MLPTRPLQTSRSIQAYELVAPDGQIHRFPKPTWLQRACMRLHALVEPAILSVVILGLTYTAGGLAEPLAPIAADACTDQTSSRTNMLLWARGFAA